MRPRKAESERPPRRARLSGSERRAELLDCARALIVEQGYLPLSMEALAQAAGVSKALVYAHFPDQHALYGAVVEAELDDLNQRGLAEVSVASEDLAVAACAAADLYLAHVAERGTVLHLIFRDPYMAGRLPERARRVRDAVLGGFARAVRHGYGLPAAEAVGAVSLALTIPEEVGRLVFQGALSPERGGALCRELVLGALAALVEPPRP